jgi:hypothetical protein
MAENVICARCGYSIGTATSGEFVGQWVHVLTGNTMCALTAVPYGTEQLDEIGLGARCSSANCNARISNLRDILQRNEQIAGRDGTELGKERAAAYYWMLELVDSLFTFDQEKEISADAPAS